MFLDSRDEWGQAGLEAVDSLKRLLKSQGDPRSDLFCTRSAVTGPLLVTDVRKREIRCYPGWWLYEFAIDLKQLKRRSGYQSGAVYALMSEDRAVILNGTSPVIHELNAGGEKVASPLQLESNDQYLDYLRFFCTFVAGEDGPFLIVETQEDFPWIGDDERDPEEDFKNLIRDKAWSAPPITVAGDDLRQLLDAKDREGAMKELQAAVASIRQARRREPVTETTTKIADQLKEARIPPERLEDGRAKAKACVLYGRHLFAAEFAIAKTGMVEMLEDEPLRAELPVRKRGFDPDLPILFLEGPPRVLSGEEFAKELLDGARPGDEEVTNVWITGDVVLSGKTVDASVRLKKVYIDGDVKLDDARISRSLSLESVRTRGRLIARNMVCDGALSLRGAEVHGYYDLHIEGRNLSREERVALGLRGARIASALDLRRTLIRGGADLDDIKVGAAARLSGLRVDTHGPHPSSPGLSAKGALFESSLDIGVDDGEWIQERRIRQDPQHARVVGGVHLEGANIKGDIVLNQLESAQAYSPANLAELTGDRSVSHLLVDSEGRLLRPWPGPIEMGSTKIGGQISAGGVTACWFGLSGATVSASVLLGSQVWRDGTANETRLGPTRQEDNDACLRLWSAKIGGSVWLSGAHLFGSINANGTTIGGMLDGDPNDWMLTRIDGGVDLSGSTIGSDIRFCSAQIGGLLQVITGSLKRVQLRPNFVPPQLNADKGQSGYRFPQTLVGGIVIQTVDVDFLDFYALKVEGEGESEHFRSITLDGVTVRGNLTFFRDRPDLYLLHGLGDLARKERQSDLPDLCEPRVRPTIAGNLKAASLTVRGEINLTNLKVGDNGVGGEIDLEGTTCTKLIATGRISDDDADQYDALRCVSGRNGKTNRHPRLEAKSLKLDRLHCSGDVDLSGLEVPKDSSRAPLRGEVSARSARVDGTFGFYSPHGHGQSAKIGGTLDLSLVRTPTLNISGETFIDGRRARARALKLDRADVAELNIVGPEPYQADLQDLQLAQLATPDRDDRELRQRFIQELLRTSWPFDRGIYRTVERALRDEGSDARANAIYRGMRWRSLTPEMPPSRGAIVGPIRDSVYRWLLLLLGPVMAVYASLRPAATDLGRGRIAGSLYELSLGLLWRILRWPFTLGEAVLIGWGTGYWTQGYRILLLTLAITLPLSWYAFSVPENIAPTTYRLGESVPDVQTISRKTVPTTDEWTMVERVRLIAATHIPVIPFIDGARWEPAENRPLCLPDDLPIGDLASLKDQGGKCPRGTWAVAGGISPAAYGLIVRALHWIAWPLFLIGISGVIQRTGRQ